MRILSKWCQESEWNFEASLIDSVDFNNSTVELETTILWSAQPELRSWGFKGFTFTVPDQVVVFKYYDENDNQQTKEITIKDVECQVTGNIARGDVCLSKLEIDLSGVARAFFE